MASGRRSRRQVIIARVALVIGLLCLVMAGSILFDYVHTTQIGPVVPASTVVRTDTHATEKSAPVTDDYSVPAGQPRVIAIPAITVNAYVQRVGVTKDNAMATPDNINFTGWYTGSVTPGAAGNSIINGHVTGKYSDGVFKHLASLKAGDLIKIQMGDSSWRQFTVRSITNYAVDKAADPLYATPDGAHQLTLITCGGAFDNTTQHYNERTIVKADLAE